MKKNCVFFALERPNFVPIALFKVNSSNSFKFTMIYQILKIGKQKKNLQGRVTKICDLAWVGSYIIYINRPFCTKLHTFFLLISDFFINFCRFVESRSGCWSPEKTLKSDFRLATSPQTCEVCRVAA